MKVFPYKQQFLTPGWGGSRRSDRGIILPEAGCGFTLIELLVVISIIAILLSIMMPALNRARGMAKRTVCLSNMRQMGLTVQEYLMDSDDHLPPTSHVGDPEKYWLRVLAKYSKQTLLFRCPADKADNFVDWTRPLNSQPADLRYSSYAVNYLLDPQCTRYYIGPKYDRVSNVRKPDYCIWVSEAPTNSTFTRSEHIHPESWEGAVDYAKLFIAWNRHLGTSNYLFVDGHAENLIFEDTYAWPTPCYWYPESAPAWPANP